MLIDQFREMLLAFVSLSLYCLITSDSITPKLFGHVVRLKTKRLAHRSIRHSLLEKYVVTSPLCGGVKYSLLNYPTRSQLTPIAVKTQVILNSKFISQITSFVDHLIQNSLL